MSFLFIRNWHGHSRLFPILLLAQAFVRSSAVCTAFVCVPTRWIDHINFSPIFISPGASPSILSVIMPNMCFNSCLPLHSVCSSPSSTSIDQNFSTSRIRAVSFCKTLPTKTSALVPWVWQTNTKTRKTQTSLCSHFGNALCTLHSLAGSLFHLHASHRWRFGYSLPALVACEPSRNFIFFILRHKIHHTEDSETDRQTAADTSPAQLVQKRK